MIDPIKSGDYLYVTDDDDRIVHSETAWEYTTYIQFANFVRGDMSLANVPIEAAYMAEASEPYAFYMIDNKSLGGKE